MVGALSSPLELGFHHESVFATGRICSTFCAPFPAKFVYLCLNPAWNAGNLAPVARPDEAAEVKRSGIIVPLSTSANDTESLIKVYPRLQQHLAV